MSPRRSTVWRARWSFGVVLATAMTMGFTREAGAQRPALPDGTGADLVRSKCLSCHDVDLITQQRLERAAWEREIDKMIRWGTALTPDERGVLRDYLAAAFGRRPADASTGATDRGADILRTRCMACHSSDLIEQQRLGRAGWVREVDKMIRWGATLTDAEKESLIDYLTNRFGSR